MTQTAPRLRNQTTGRNVLRILGLVLFGTGLLLTVIGFLALIDTMQSDSFGPPTRFFLAFVGLPLLGVGGWCLQAGFLGAAARYTVGEVGPTARDTMRYLGVSTGTVSCPSCGADNDPAARFCDDCGTGLSRGCDRCGKANAADARFCADCGTALA